MPREGMKGKARVAAQQFLIKERVLGPSELQREDFRSLVHRFADIADLPYQDVRAPAPLECLLLTSDLLHDQWPAPVCLRRLLYPGMLSCGAVILLIYLCVFRQRDGCLLPAHP